MAGWVKWEGALPIVECLVVCGVVGVVGEGGDGMGGREEGREI